MSVKEITVEEFDKADPDKVTILDLREKDETLVFGIPDALNLPFSATGEGIDLVPKGKPVYVVCRTGDWSQQIAEILEDRGYEAYSLKGGIQAYRKYLQDHNPDKYAQYQKAEEKVLAVKKEPEVKKPLYIDAKGLKCPGPIVKVADTLKTLNDGDRVYVEATEDAFASDIRVWTERTGNKLINETVSSGLVTAEIEKSSVTKTETVSESDHEKTFVIFSGDLDKTIAVFIMANGAAAMGRQVTMFFTFWGLNVLRKPEKVKVKKNFIGKLFGVMMPRGTKKLGLSRMNFGGMGAKMIRSVMKQNGIESVEELMDDAVKHGVRLVACQMSMDIMGITKEELIDGVELGGVATMLGSAEKSDLTYFI